jgi:hypothetical protein
MLPNELWPSCCKCLGYLATYYVEHPVRACDSWLCVCGFKILSSYSVLVGLGFDLAFLQWLFVVGLGFSLAGLQYRYECWCGQTMSEDSVRLIEERCNSACPDFTASAHCGGFLAMSVYKTGFGGNVI